jgi:hypothetical protein
MSGPKRAVPTNKGRYYTDPQDVLKRYVSVTNVIDTINKPALVGWAARTVAEQAVNDLVLVTKMSRTDKDGAIAYLKGKPYAEKDAAANLGSRIHGIAEGHELGHDMPELADDERAMVEQYLAFRDDWKPTYEATEATVCNRTHAYAGTLDGLLRFQQYRLPKAGDALVVGDYKTGRTGPYAEWGLQLAAYANAEALWLPDDSEVAMPQVAGGVVIRIRPDFYGVYELDPAAMPVLFEVFTHLIHVTRWLHNDTQQACFSDRLIPQRTTAAEVA